MSKFSYTAGSSTLSDFFWFIQERHLIWRRRAAGEKFPWTEDGILQTYKFTSVFRELDKGTVALRDMIAAETDPDPEDIIFNVVWYRLFNRLEHAVHPGFCTYAELSEALREKRVNGELLFTSAHMTWGPPGQTKLDAFLKSLSGVWHERKLLCERIMATDRLEFAFGEFLPYDGIGPFIAYEIVSDLRWELQPDKWIDALTWVNIGPGCKRGLERLGLPATLESVRLLYYVAENRLPADGVQSLLADGEDYSTNDNTTAFALDEELQKHHVGLANFNSFFPSAPLFELREIEHCLCEFDKYERARSGVGRPREMFTPPDERAK